MPSINCHLTIKRLPEGVHIAVGDGWSVSSRGQREVFDCIYAEGIDRQLKFFADYGGGVDLGDCKWRWEGDIGTKDEIPLGHRQVIIERITAGIRALFQTRGRIETYRLKVGAGLLPTQPAEPAPDSIHVIRIGEDLRFSYGVRTLSVPLDFRRAEHEGAIAVRRADFERWDDPYAYVRLEREEIELAVNLFSSYCQTHYGRPLVMFR